MERHSLRFSIAVMYILVYKMLKVFTLHNIVVFPSIDSDVFKPERSVERLVLGASQRVAALAFFVGLVEDGVTLLADGSLHMDALQSVKIYVNVLFILSVPAELPSSDSTTISCRQFKFNSLEIKSPFSLPFTNELLCRRDGLTLCCRLVKGICLDR